MSPAELRSRIEQRDATIGVVGLGYVGLPVACIIAELGFTVLGVEIKSDRVASIAEGRSPIEGNEPGLAELLSQVVQSGRLRATTEYAELSKADVVLISVETPVSSDHRPHYTALKAACRSLGAVMKSGTLVIVESTVAPGTLDNVVRPLLEEASGMRLNREFYLGTCPERVMPGKLLRNLRAMSRVCGASSPEVAETMAALYRLFVQAEIDLADMVTAEMVKTVENAYRDVQIAFANEVALICEANGADVWRVRELVNKSPYRQMHLPGAGVGGHCIPKDPWLLAYSVEGKGVPLRLIPAAREVNDSMPLHMIELLQDALAEAGRELAGARVLVLGYAYLEDSDDTRNSPSEELVQKLRTLGAEVCVHDPYVPGLEGDVEELAEGVDAAVVMVKHRQYADLHLPRLATRMRTPVLVDGRRRLDPEQVASIFVFRGVGQRRKVPPPHAEQLRPPAG